MRGDRKENHKRKEKQNDQNKEKQPSAVLFVPRTRGGKLANLLKEKEKELAKKTFRLQE